MTILSWGRHHRTNETGWDYRHAFVCSGGGNLGAAQVGMFRGLMEAGVLPDVLVGCSVGALNAAFLAADPTLDRVTGLERVWRSLGGPEVFGGNRRTMAAHLLRKHDHVYDGAGLRALIARELPLRDLSETRVPVHVVTTDLGTGQSAWWSAGDPVDILSASACLPGLLPPVWLDGSMHVDGGVLDPVPTRRALELRAETVWVLDVGGDRLPALPERPSALDILLASFGAARRALLADPAQLCLPGQHVVTIPLHDAPRMGVRDFSRTSELIRAGERAATEALLDVPALAG